MDAGSLLSLEDMCRRLPEYELNTQKLTRWIRKGYRGRFLKGRLIGHKWKVRPVDLEAFLDQVLRDTLPPEAFAGER